MSAFPVMLDGSKLTALVVGGGQVALRKTAALLDGGVRVRLVATRISPELRSLAAADALLGLFEEPYSDKHLEGAAIVIAATDDAVVNRRIAADGLRQRRLVNVVDVPELGNFVTAATHRAGDLTIAVSAGRLPAAAAAVRDAIAARFDHRYASSIAELRELRDHLLDSGNRDAWKTIVAELVDDGFCADVENGAISAKVGAWR